MPRLSQGSGGGQEAAVEQFTSRWRRGKEASIRWRGKEFASGWRCKKGEH